MTETIRGQILDIRDTGLTNMFDLNMVQRLAYDRNYYELVCFIEEHRSEYVHFILTGEENEPGSQESRTALLVVYWTIPATHICAHYASELT